MEPTSQDRSQFETARDSVAPGARPGQEQIRWTPCTFRHSSACRQNPERGEAESPDAKSGNAIRPCREFEPLFAAPAERFLQPRSRSEMRPRPPVIAERLVRWRTEPQPQRLPAIGS